MKRKVLSLICLLAVLLFAGNCRTRTDRSSAPVVLTFGQIGPVPVVVSVGTANGIVQIPTFTLLSVVKDPTGSFGQLDNVEVTSYQVTYRRRDTGTRVPPALVAAIFQAVPANGTGVISNLPILRIDQLGNPPLVDLAISPFRDSETGTAVIVLDVQIQFFGNTLSGDAIASPLASYTIEFTP